MSGARKPIKRKPGEWALITGAQIRDSEMRDEARRVTQEQRPSTSTSPRRCTHCREYRIPNKSGRCTVCRQLFVPLPLQGLKVAG